MPSAAHEIPLQALREHPHALSVLCSLVGLPAVPPKLEVRDSLLRQIDVAEVRPDLVLEHDGGVLFVELQARIDESKRVSWPRALSVSLERGSGLAALVVVVRTREVARWARRGISWKNALGTSLRVRPAVVHITRAVAARLVKSQVPALVTLGVWAVSRRKGDGAASVVVEGLREARGLGEPLRWVQVRAILGMLGDALREKVTEMFQQKRAQMSAADRKWARELDEFIARLRELAIARIKEEALDEGWAKGEAEGEARGKAEGEARGKAEAVLAVLEARGLAVSEAQRRRVLGCTQVATLDRWLRAAATAPSATAALSARRR